MDAKVCIQMEGKKTTITNPGVSEISCLFVALRRWLFYYSCGCSKLFDEEIEFQLLWFQSEDKDFTYDFSYWSADSSDRHFASQEQVKTLYSSNS